MKQQSAVVSLDLNATWWTRAAPHISPIRTFPKAEDNFDFFKLNAQSNSFVTIKIALTVPALGAYEV